MATNTGNEKNTQQNKWESFTAKFKPGTIITMPDLRMTAQEGFCLSDLSDLETSQNMLAYVKSLNISDNLIPKLRLRNFNSIETLDASRNMVGEVILNLTNLQTLNLSFNLISKVFELKDLPNLVNLNLSYNIIEKISVKDFFDVKKNLKILDLSYNKINLEAYDFISFFEGLKNFNIKNLKIKENTFLAKSAALNNFYKVYVSLCIPGLEEIDGETIKIDPSIGNLNDLTNQILMDAADLQRDEIRKKLKIDTAHFKDEVNKELRIETPLGAQEPNETREFNQNNKSGHFSTQRSQANSQQHQMRTIPENLEFEKNAESENAYNNKIINSEKNNKTDNKNSRKSTRLDAKAADESNYSSKSEEENGVLEKSIIYSKQINVSENENYFNIIDLIKRIMKNLDNIYIAKFDFQSLYLEILDDLMLLISGKYKNFSESDQEELRSLFAILLAKLHCFMENADKKEESTILKIIANLAFIEKGCLSKMVFDFLKSLIISSDVKVIEIGKLVKEALTDNLNEIINEWAGEFTILQHITDFFDDSFPINLDDVFQENIQQFLLMFKKIWGIKGEYNAKSASRVGLCANYSGNGDLNAIEEAENEEDINDEDYEFDELQNSFQLKKTSIVILSKYFQILVDKSKTLKSMPDETKDEETEEEINEENNYNEIENDIENENDNDNEINQTNRTENYQEEIRVDYDNHEKNNTVVNYNEANETRSIKSASNFNESNNNEKTEVFEEISLNKNNARKIIFNKSYNENNAFVNKLNASDISNNYNNQKCESQDNFRKNLSLNLNTTQNSQINNFNKKNTNNSLDNNYIVKNNNFNKNYKDPFELSIASNKKMELNENESSSFPNRKRTLEEGKETKSISIKNSNEIHIEEEIKQRKNSNNNINTSINKSKKSSGKIPLEIQHEGENLKNSKLENEKLVNQSINSGRGVIISEKDYSKLKEKLENSKLLSDSNNNINRDNKLNENSLRNNSIKKIEEKINQSKLSIDKENKSKPSSKQNSVAKILNEEDEFDKEDIIDNIQHLKKMELAADKLKQNPLVDQSIESVTSIHFKTDNLHERKIAMQEVHDISKISKKSRVVNNNSNIHITNFHNDEINKEEEDILYNNKNACKNNSKNLDNNDSIRFKTNINQNKNNNSELIFNSKTNNKNNNNNNNYELANYNNTNDSMHDHSNIKSKNLNKSLENKNISNNLMKSSISKNHPENIKASKSVIITSNNKALRSNFKKIENLLNNNSHNNISNSSNSSNSIAEKPKRKIDFNNNPISLRINKTQKLKKRLINSSKEKKTNNQSTNKSKSKSEQKLDLGFFADFYVKMKTKIECDFQSFTEIKNQEDLEIFKAFLDFSSLFFQHIKQLCQKNLLVVNSKISIDMNLHSILGSDEFADYLLKLVEQLFKRYRIEESDREENQFDRKFESYFSEYLKFKREAHAKSGLSAAANESPAEDSGSLVTFRNDANAQKSGRTVLATEAKLNKTVINGGKNNINNNHNSNNNRNYGAESYSSHNKFTLFEELCELKELVISVVKCVASTFRLSEPGHLQQNFEREVIKKIIGISKKSVQIDPFIMEASCSFILILLGDDKTKTDYMIFYNLINKVENYSNFKNLLDLINVNSKKYQDFINYLYLKTSKTKVIITDYNLDKIDGVRIYVKRVIQSIITIFKRMAKYVSATNPTILRTAKELGNCLRGNNQFAHLGNCLKIDEDAIRLNAIKTIFYSKSDKIDLKIMDDLMKTISEYSSITEGETEIILSIVYLLFNQIVFTQVNTSESLTHPSILNALEKAFEFMEKNLERKAPNENELVQKNELSLSLLLYISTLSKYQIGKGQQGWEIENAKNCERFYKILEYDYSIYEKSFYIPVEIERTLLGAKVKNYFEITKRLDNPYSYNFLRVLMKVADILCEIPDFSMPFSLDIKSKKIISALDAYINQRFLFRVYNESLAWNDFASNLDKFVQDYKSIKEFINERKKKYKRLLIRDQEKLNVYRINAEKVTGMNAEITDAVLRDKLSGGDKINTRNAGDAQEKDVKEKVIEKIHELLSIDTTYLKEKGEEKEKRNLNLNFNAGSKRDFKSSNAGNNTASALNIDVNNNKNGENTNRIDNNNNNNNKSFNNKTIRDTNEYEKKDVTAGFDRKADSTNRNSVQDNRRKKASQGENENLLNYEENNNNEEEEEEEQNATNETLANSSNTKTRKNLIMDYFAIVLAKVEEKLKKKSDSQNSNLSKSTQQIKAYQYAKQDQRDFSNLYEQIDFIIFFPSLMNYLTGKSPKLLGKNIIQELYNKYDQEVIEAIKKFKAFSCVEDLKSFVLINTSNVMQDGNLKFHIKSYYLDSAELRFSESLIKKREDVSDNSKANSSTTDFVKNSIQNKNADLFNYKEDFYKNSINFNKKTFSQFFQMKSKNNIYWKNEIPMNFDWENIEHVKRLPEAESHNNSNTRSLLVSSLLRCVYPLLKSYSKNIRKKFIEILFSENIYYDFFLYLSSGLYLKFNIGQKLLNIISLLYGNNFHHVKEHFKAIYLKAAEANKGQKYQSDSSQQKNFSNDNNYYKEIQKLNKNEALMQHEFKFYCKLLEIISITTIFIKKIYFISFIEKNMQYRSNHNFLNVFISCLNQILNSITNCIFPDSFKESVEILIINNLIKNNLVKNILPFVSLISHLNKKVTKILYKKILMQNLYAKNLNLKENKKIDENIINYLLYFKFYLEKSRRMFINTISNLKLLCKENKNIFLKEILYFDIRDYQKQVKHKSSKFSNSSKNNNKNKDGKNQNQNQKINNNENETDNKITNGKIHRENSKLPNYLIQNNNYNLNKENKNNKNENENANKPGGEYTPIDTQDQRDFEKQKQKLDQKRKFKENFVKEIFDEHKLIKLAIELQKAYFPDETRVVECKCEVEIINDYRKSFNLFILTNANIYLFELDVEEFEKNSAFKLLRDTKYFKLDIEKLLDLKYFDYNSRLIFEYEKPANTSLESLFKKIQLRIKNKLQDESADSPSNKNEDTNTSINLNKQSSKDSNQIDVRIETANFNVNSSTSNFTGNELKKEVDDFQNTKQNSTIKSDNSFSNKNNDDTGFFSGIFAKTNFLNGILDAGSATAEERPISLFFSVCFTSLFQAANIFNLIQDANKKLKTMSNSAKPNYNLLTNFINMHEKPKREKANFKLKKDLTDKNKGEKKEVLVDEEEEEDEIPIYLEELFKEEEFKFLKNEFKIKNSFGINDNEHVNIMIKKMNAFVVNLESSNFAFNLFDSLNRNKSVLNKNRKILFLGEETLYVLEENFELLNVEFFMVNSLYIQSIEKNPSFVVAFEIDFKEILDIEIIDCQCVLDYHQQGSKRKRSIKFEVDKREENEFIYFYLMKNLVKNVINKNK